MHNPDRSRLAAFVRRRRKIKRRRDALVIKHNRRAHRHPRRSMRAQHGSPRAGSQRRMRRRDCEDAHRGIDIADIGARKSGPRPSQPSPRPSIAPRSANTEKYVRPQDLTHCRDEERFRQMAHAKVVAIDPQDDARGSAAARAGRRFRYFFEIGVRQRGEIFVLQRRQKRYRQKA